MADCKNGTFFQVRIPLVLASGSPRRREFLSAMGLDFRAVSAPEEAEPLPLPGENPEAYVLRAARAKAAYVRDSEIASGVPGAGESAYIGADTTVVLDGDILGKPADIEEAFVFLRRLAGREHRVISAVCLRLPVLSGAGTGDMPEDGAEESFAVT
ncbi:Maf family protein, partial [Desulfovibrio sp. OttesenSCG-928-I05]|nr:Maf family protein [Desulfovibrio sp. OttesenSCG-928-I05]